MSDDPGQTGGAAEEPFTGMFQRIFSDPEFADALERDPEQALREVGFDLDEKAVEELNRVRAEQGEGEVVALIPVAVAVAAPAVAVRVYTSPAVRVGTSPAVQAAVRTNVPHRDQEQFARRLEEKEKGDEEG